MPDLSRRLIKTSLIYLIAALLLGVVLSLPVVQSDALAARLYPGYIHLFMVGWLTQLIFGVAYWLFPRYSRDRPYGNRTLPEAAFILLNIGLILRLIAEPAIAATSPGFAGSMLLSESVASPEGMIAASGSILPAAAWGVFLSAVIQWLGGLAFVAYFWKRVKRR